MNSLQQEVILENYQKPYHNFTPEKYNYSHALANRSCGDEIEVFVEVDGGKVKAVYYEIKGCALSIASSSILSQALEGKSVVELSGLNESFMEDILGIKLTINRVKCALLPLSCVLQALGLKEKSDHF